jgi:hypothetical protein
MIALTIFRTHLLQTLQWWDLGGLNMQHLSQYLDLSACCNEMLPRCCCWIQAVVLIVQSGMHNRKETKLCVYKLERHQVQSDLVHYTSFKFHLR